jgi:hypothetical protein
MGLDFNDLEYTLNIDFRMPGAAILPYSIIFEYYIKEYNSWLDTVEMKLGVSNEEGFPLMV